MTAERAEIGAEEAMRHPLAQAVVSWLGGPGGRAEVVRRLAVQRLTKVQPDEVISEAYLYLARNIGRQLLRDPERDPVEYGGIVVWASVRLLMRSQVRDTAWRKEIERGAVPVAIDVRTTASIVRPEAEARPGQSERMVDLGPEWVDPLGLEAGDELRARIETSDHAPWVKSAALSRLTMHLYPRVDRRGLPAPVKGSDDDRDGWAALWLAGRRDGMFPRESDSSSPAMRQRRSRALAEVARLLDEAKALVRAGGRRT